MGSQHAPSYACAPQRQLVLRIAVEGEAERRIPLHEKPCYVLGRNPALCDVPLELRNASRAHACLAHDEEGNLHLVDLNSVHGTQLDGVELGTEGLPLDVVLKPGVPFQLAGDSLMTFTVHPADALPAATGADGGSDAVRASDLATSSGGGRGRRPSGRSARSASPSRSPSPSLRSGSMGPGSRLASEEPGERRSPWAERGRGERGRDGGSPGPARRRGSVDRERQRGERGSLEPPGRLERDRRLKGGPDRPDRGGPGPGRRGSPPPRRLSPRGSPLRDGRRLSPRGSPPRDGRRLSPPLRRGEERLDRGRGPFPPDRRPGPFPGPGFDRRPGPGGPFPGGPFRGDRFPPPRGRGRSPPPPRGRVPFRRGSPDYGPEPGMGGPRGAPRRDSPDYTDAGPVGRGGPGPRRGSPDYTDAGPTGRGAQRRGASPDGPPRRRRPPSPSPERGGGGGLRYGDARRGPPFGHGPPHLMPRGVQRGFPPGERPRGPLRRPLSRSPPPPRRGGRSPSPPVRRGDRGDSPPPRHRDRSPPPRQQPPQPQPPPVASNPLDAAALVRQMMGGSGAAPAAAPAGGPPRGAGLSVDQKKRLLWGAKKAEEGAERFGANRWDAAEFGSEAERLKFHRLMGVKADFAAAEGPVPQQVQPAPQQQQGGVPDAMDIDDAAGEQQPHKIMKRETQEQVLGQLEREFTTGVQRSMHNRTGGLGL